MKIGRQRSYDGTPPATISAAMIRDAFHLDDDAVLLVIGNDNQPIEVSTLSVGERSPISGVKIDQHTIPGNFLG